jgi:hypothetical protein
MFIIHVQSAFQVGLADGSRFNYQRNFDSLFAKENLTLQEVLNEEEIKTGFINPSEAMGRL